MPSSPQDPAVFSLLTTLYRDPEMNAVFSVERTVQGWLDAEVALARAQAHLGELTPEDAERIAQAAQLEGLDLEALWTQARNVGYPILPLIRMVAARLPEGTRGKLHYGATTQDIMDTGLSLQLRAACEVLERRLLELGEVLCDRVLEHVGTVMPARTHAQQAVPTSLGAKLASYLSEVSRQLERIRRSRLEVSQVSLFGAGGTSAALGPQVGAVRQHMARLLGLEAAEVPWHVSRDVQAEFGARCASICATLARFAREVIDLSRTEIAELHEPGGLHRGASSTMPQKENPINSEGVIGLSAVAGALSSALYRAMESGHERAAGEWQIEWQVLPQLATLTGGALVATLEVVKGLRVSPEAMRRNLSLDGGLIMSEAYMIRLAPILGQGAAHERVYQAAQQARARGITLEAGVLEDLPLELRASIEASAALAPEDYLGRVVEVCGASVAAWHQLVPLSPRPHPPEEVTPQ